MAVDRNTVYRLEAGGPDLPGLLRLLEEAHGAPSVAALAPWAFVVVQAPFEPLFFRGAREVVTPFELDVAALAVNAAWLVIALAEHNSPRADESAFAAAAALYSAARREGWGSVWYQPLDASGIMERISAPKWYRLAAVVAIGRPAEATATYQEKPLDTVVVLHQAGHNKVLKDAGS